MSWKRWIKLTDRYQTMSGSWLCWDIEKARPFIPPRRTQRWATVHSKKVCSDLKLLLWKRRRIEKKKVVWLGGEREAGDDWTFLRKTPLCISVTGKQRCREWLYSLKKNKRSSDQLLLSPRRYSVLHVLKITHKLHNSGILLPIWRLKKARFNPNHLKAWI